MSITSTLVGLLRTKAKGTTAAGALTSKAVDANTQSLHVSLADQLPVGANTIGNVKLTDGTVTVGSEPYGALQVNIGPSTIFYDSYSVSPIDTTDKWLVVGNTPVIANGVLQMSSVLSTYNAIRAKDPVRANSGYTLCRNAFSIETTTTTGVGRFFGLGTPAIIPAANSIVQDGVGFELDQATGSLLAVTYAAGVRTTVATLTRATDGLVHAYGIYFRVTQAFWIIDGVTVASQSYPNVQVVELPAMIARQNASAFTGSPIFTAIATLVADTSKQVDVIGDPVIGMRQARVKAASTPAVAADSALVVTLSPNGPGNQPSSLAVPVVMASDQLMVNDVSTSKELLTKLLIEMRVTNLILHSTLQCKDDLDSLRIDAQSTVDQI